MRAVSLGGRWRCLSVSSRAGSDFSPHFLHTRLLPALGGEALSGWKGPQGAHQDFQFSAVWIEVKTTFAKQPQTVRITSERQLDDTRAPALFLHVLMLEPQQGGAATLPALVAQMRATLGTWPVARESFEEALLAGGYLDKHAPHYAGVGYAVRQCQDFRVAPGFPRIVESDLPPGIGDASYRLSLAACSGFIVPPEALVATLLPPADPIAPSFS
jgi:hypothetical protein